MIGRKISHYKILEKIAEGGMGVVYRAEDTKLGRIVAMKFLPPHVGSDEEKKQRFIQEAKTASLIDHPNIGTIHEIDETEDGYLYIVMSCYDGKSLKNKIEEGPLTVDDSIDIALQIAMGMVKAHEHGVIHRDLKPGNILITNDNVAKIIDFGLAKLSGGLQLTKSNTSLGTVAYMSPEQARGEEVDARSDIWSLGIILFEMLTSKLPFRGEFETAMMYSIANENPLPIETFRSAIPFDLKLIIAKSLQKDRKDRYQSMNELVTDLKALRKHPEADSTAVSDWKSATRAVGYAIKHDRKKVILISIPIILAVLALIIFYFSNAKHTSISTSKYIAVLPVTNVGNPEQIYYSNGFTEEISNELSSLPNVTVFGRTSVTAVLEGGKVNDSLIVAKLGARYLLKGNMQLLASRIKYNVRLVDGESSNELWSNQYDVSRGDIFTVKEEVIRAIADNMGISSELIPKSKYRTAPDTYESYLHGIYYRDKNTKDDNLLAITFFTEAIRKDSNYVPALVSLANAQVERYRQGWDYSEKQLTDAEILCKMALSLDSSNTSALAENGIIADLKGDTNKGLRLLLQAYDNDKNKNNSTVISAIAYIYLFKLGDPSKGLMYSKRFYEIDPLNYLASLDLGVAYAQLKNNSEAINSFRISYQLNPLHGWAPYSLGYAYERINQFDSSIYYYKISLKNDPTYPQTYESLNSVYLATNNISAAESIMTSGFHLLPDDPQIIYSLGLAYLFGKKQHDAKNTFELGMKLFAAKIKKDPQVSDYHAWHGLFLARLGDPKATRSFAQAVKLDSTNEEIIMSVTRGYAILGMKTEMLQWFKRSKAMNPEYDAAYLRTALDFEKYRSDPDLLIIARQ